MSICLLLYQTIIPNFNIEIKKKLQSSVFAEKNLRKSFEKVENPVIVKMNRRGGRNMLEEYRTVLGHGESEIVEKKSRFLAEVSHIDTEEEALEFIEKIRKKHYNATHHCYAYVLGERFELQRFSDDGEPGGTAGKPMLDVLTGEGIHDTVVVVTRYFGGTLLGTGGLVRAYSGAAKEGLLASTIITRKYASKLGNPDGIYRLENPVYSRTAGDSYSGYTIYRSVASVCLVPDVEKGKIEKELTEGTNGQAGLGWKEKCYFAVHEGKILLFNK